MLNNLKYHDTVVILNIWTDRPEQTVHTPISSLIRIFTVCYSICIFWTHICLVKLHYSNFRIKTAVFRVSIIFRTSERNLIVLNPGKSRLKVRLFLPVILSREIKTLAHPQHCRDLLEVKSRHLNSAMPPLYPAP